MKKIVLVGPVYPYKGGIAHYTSLLYQVLAEKYDVEMLSFKMQYPKFLFKKEQKDYRNDMFKVEKAQFLLHTANPFNIVTLGRRIRRQNPDLLILQWWHPYFAPCFRLLTAAAGGKVPLLYICHNVLPHERFPMDKLLTKAALGRGDLFIVHSRSDGEELLKLKKEAKFMRNPHPTYGSFQVRNLTKSQARAELGRKEEEKILLFFGFVREYKGLKTLLRAMPKIKACGGDIILVVAGSFDGDREEYVALLREMHIEEIVHIVDGYLPDNEVEKYFAACDLVVAPYESATQSGIVQIAFGFEKPVVATNVGGLPDVVEDGRTGYVVEPGDPEALAEAVVKFFREKKGSAFRENVRQEAGRFSWEKMRETIEEMGRF